MRFLTIHCRKLGVNLLKNGTDISISTVSHDLSKEFGLKSYKPAAKFHLTSAVKKRDYCLPINILFKLWKNEKQFYSLTNLPFSSLQCRRSTFKDQSVKGLMQSTPSVE